MPEEASDGLRKLLLGLLGCGVVFAHQQHDAAHQIALGDDRRRDAEMVPLDGLGGTKACVACAIAVALALLHDLLQLGGVALFQQLPLRRTRNGNDRVTVGDRRNMTGVFPDGLADLCRKALQLAHRGILLENNLPVPLRINLQWVALADTEGAANFFGYDDATEVIDASDNAGSFHIQKSPSCA